MKLWNVLSTSHWLIVTPTLQKCWWFLLMDALLDPHQSPRYIMSTPRPYQRNGRTFPSWVACVASCKQLVGIRPQIKSDRWALTKSQVSVNPVASPLSFPFPKFPRFIRLGKGLSKRRPDGSNGACRGRGQSGHLLVIFWLCLSVRCNFYPPSLGTVHVWTRGGMIVQFFT